MPEEVFNLIEGCPIVSDILLRHIQVAIDYDELAPNIERLAPFLQLLGFDTSVIWDNENKEEEE